MTERGKEWPPIRPGSPEQARAVVERLTAGRDLDGLGLPHIGGRWDLRGLRASGDDLGQGAAVVVFRGARLASLDLREALLSGWRLHDSRIEDCRFDAADCRDWRMWHSSVVDSVFDGADLSGSAVGTWDEGHRNTWRRVSLRGSRFSVAVAWAALFEDCDFTGADLTAVHFEQCDLLRCRFAGNLHRVLFDGRDLPGRPPSSRLDGVDFSEARFDQVDFYGFHLGGTALPEDPDLRVLHRYPCVVERALSLLADDRSRPAVILRADLAARWQIVAQGSHDDDANVLNRRDYLPDGGDELVNLAVEVLSRAERECRTRSASQRPPSVPSASPAE